MLSWMVITGAAATITRNATTFSELSYHNNTEESLSWDRDRRWLQQSSNTKIRGRLLLVYLIHTPG